MANHVSRNALLALFALVVFASPCLAQGHGQGNPHKQKGQDQQDEDNQGENDDRDEGGRARPIFRQHDRDIIISFYHSHPSNLPPGLAKRNGNLPPGLEKHLERNGTLPPGLQKRLEPLPRELEIRLPRLPDIYVRRTVGPDVIIMNEKTGAIVDIIGDVAVLARR